MITALLALVTLTTFGQETTEKKDTTDYERDLQEVVVTSTLLKFYMDGDTLVYNADAFSMAEGSMLSDLIKKLPGAELTEGGVIKINGRRVNAMLLNGKTFFNEDRELLLDNMPSYMVKNFKAYERVPEAVRGTRLENTTEKEYVMDVRLKREYSVGWVTNAEVGGGSTFYNNTDGRLDGKHIARLFGLRFTDKSRTVAYVNANNLNDTDKPGRQGDWAELKQSKGLKSTVNAGTNYGYEEEYGRPRYHAYQGAINGSYSDASDSQHSNNATFLDGGNTYARSFYDRRDYSWSLNTNHSFTYRQQKVGNLFKSFFWYVAPSFNYDTFSQRMNSADATFNTDVASGLGKSWMDSIAAPDAGELLKQYAVNRTRSTSQVSGRLASGILHTYANLYPARRDFWGLTVSSFWSFADNSNTSYEHYLLDYPTDGTKPLDYRNRYTPTHSKMLYGNVTPDLTFFLDKANRKTLNLSYQYYYNRSDNDDPIYLLNRLKGWEQPDSQPLGLLPSAEEVLTTMDMSNSMRSIETTIQHKPKITFRYSHRNDSTQVQQSLSTTFAMNYVRKTLDYQQGSLMDTLATRFSAMPEARIEYTIEAPKQDRRFVTSYNFRMGMPWMRDMLNIRYDNNPLYVGLGNPDLKNTAHHELNLSYRDKWGKTLFNASAEGRLQTNAVAYGFIYDRETGVRTTKPENINGNWQANADAGIDMPLDKKDRLRLKESAKYSYQHSVDLAGTSDNLVATRSTVGSHYVTEKLSLDYQPTSKLEFGLSGTLVYQHSNGSRENFQTLDVFTYHYGANAQLELPWNFQISTDLTMYSRRGYSEASMNTNELVWNARLAKRLMHGNLTLLFDGFDLLGNLSNVRRSINAQGRTETFYNVIPSYGLFHAIYRLNKQPKNKK